MGMVQSKERAFKQLELLVKRFKNDLKKGVINGSHKKSSEFSFSSDDGKKYSESQVRQSYILPMFRDVLGWNIDDSVNEVIPELHNHEGFADFTFVRSGKKKFLLETKKPFVNIDPNVQSGRDALRQAIGYSRSIKDIHIAMVSNFELLVFGHAYAMPKKGEEMRNCLGWFHFSDFLNDDAFDMIWEFRFDKVGSKDFGASLLGNIDRRLISQYKPIDENLLDDLKTVRVEIANCIKPVSLKLHKREESVQLLVNRVIFMRALEDRGVISKSIFELLEKKDIWSELGKHTDYIFSKFPVEILDRKRGATLDLSTTSFKDEDLKIILQMFYNRGSKFFHDCYDFKYIPSDILGYAYEHSIAFQLISDSKTKKFKLEKKKLYKNGVHYTPSYISTELANTTIDRAVANLGKKPKDLICFDIACGSGSFLTSVYDTIYKLHLKTAKDLQVDMNGTKILSLHDRKMILENCIFGIDIDYFAVQISRLCLYLKFFENFPASDLDKKCQFIPNLNENVVFGDSLLDVSQNAKHPKNSLPLGDDNRKVFKFIKNKEIDVIVGNPPYIKIQDLKKVENIPVEHYKSIYSKTMSKGSIEFAIGFVERAMNLLQKNGVLGYIIPNKIFRNKQGEDLRELISNPSNECNLYQFTDFNSTQIFDASIYTCLLYLERKKLSSSFKCCQIYSMGDPSSTLSEVRKTKSLYPSKHFEVDNLKSSDLSKDPWNLLIGKKRDLFLRLNSKFKSLENIAVDNKIFQGIPTGSDKVYLMEKVGEKNSKVWLMKSEAFELIVNFEKKKHGSSKKNSIFEIEKQYLKPVFNGSRDLKSFNINKSDSYVLYPYDEQGTLLKDKAFFGSKAYYFLNQKEIKFGFKDEKNKTVLYGLNERESGRFAGKYFYQYSYPKNMTLWNQPKIMIPYLVERFNAHLNTSGHVFINVSTGGYCILAPTDKRERIHLLGILNSKVFDFMVKCFSGDFRGGWIECNKHYIGAAPVPLVDDLEFPSDEAAQLESCLSSLYSTSDAYYSETQNESQLKELNAFYRNIEWLDTWAKKVFGLTEEEYKTIEFYAADGSSPDDIFDLQKAVNNLNTDEQGNVIEDDVKAV